MKKNSEESRHADAGAGVSRSRRRLVKNAVVAAPVILTLPSGAAAATASAFQCIARDHATAEANPPADLVDAPDAWVRTETHCTSTTDPNTGQTVLQETGDPNAPLCYKLVRFDLDGNVVTTGGGPVTPSCYASFG